MNMKAILSTGCRLIGMLIFFTGCSREESPPSENPPVGVVTTSTHEFTLHTGPDGTLYTIRDRDGKPIAREISGQDLAAEFPGLSEELRSLWAGSERGQATDLILRGGASFETVDKSAPLMERIARPDRLSTPAR